MTITPNDPKLTTFVLGELSEEESAEVQAQIDRNPELREEADAIRFTADQVRTAMAREPVFGGTQNKGLSPAAAGIAARVQGRNSRLIRAAAMTALAVCIAVFAVVCLWTQPAGIARKDAAPHAIPHNVCEAMPEDNLDSMGGSLGNSGNGDRVDAKKEAGAPLASAPPEKLAAETPIGDVRSESLMPAQIAQFSRGAVQSSGPNVEKKAKQSHADAGRRMIMEEADEDRPLGESTVTAPATLSYPASRLQSISNESQSFRPPQSSDGRQSAKTELLGKLAEAPASDADGKWDITGIQPMPMPLVPVIDERRKPDAHNAMNDEAYKEFIENDFKPVKTGEFSTFSVDVDTASYSTMRRYIEGAKRPPKTSVRLEEYVNYFRYDYAPPEDGKPFATHVDVFPCPWNKKHHLARIGIKGKEYSADKRPPLNLVFLVDVSGSMEASNRLPLVQKGLADLTEMLQAKDRVAIVTYAGASRVALPSVSGSEKRAILDSIQSLSAGGSTAGAAGIKTAYETARKYYDKEAQNRVILCTDGDFNVGETNNKTLEEMIGEEAKSGVFLTILGYGMGNYKDDRLKTLSMRGNGNYGYIDTPEENRKLLVEGLTSTLFAIAKDVKIQVDFNPAKVAGYRLLGYENRKLQDEDFHNDAVDAGEVGSGHTVTALYEIVPAGEPLPAAVDKSRYETPAATPETTPDAVPGSNHSDELMFVKLRYKEPDGSKSSLLEYPVKDAVKDAGGDAQFASAVALFGMLLRDSRHSGEGTWEMVLSLAEPNTKDDKYRKEFIELVKKAKAAERN